MIARALVFKAARTNPRMARINDIIPTARPTYAYNCILFIDTRPRLEY